ncbi:hypothetical protein HMPREF1199_01599 [Hoylesella oralis CC98A]|nr:hypothetical protein HMPREF1199_01599 [Hoylesella oralis CC98A]
MIDSPVRMNYGQFVLIIKIHIVQHGHFLRLAANIDENFLN